MQVFRFGDPSPEEFQRYLNVVTQFCGTLCYCHGLNYACACPKDKPIIFDGRFNSSLTSQNAVVTTPAFLRDFWTNATSVSLQNATTSRPLSYVQIDGRPVNNREMYSGGNFTRILADRFPDNPIFNYDLIDFLRQTTSEVTIPTAALVSGAGSESFLITENASFIPLSYRPSLGNALGISDVVVFNLGLIFPKSRISLVPGGFRLDNQGSLISFYRLISFPEGYFLAAGWVRDGETYRFDPDEAIIEGIKSLLGSG